MKKRHHHLCTARSAGRAGTELAPSQPIQTRTFFRLPEIPNPGKLLSKEKKFRERKIIGYSAEEMYSVVVDVNRYEDFLPWCKKSSVTLSTPTYLEADLMIGFPPITESYTSYVTMRKPHLVKAESRNGHLFVGMTTIWKLGPGLPGNSRTCTLDIDVTFEFRSALHSKLATLFFEEVARKMANAFLQRAHVLYGKESIKTQVVFQNTYS